MITLGIDPGDEFSAYCLFDGEKFVEFDKLPNAELELILGHKWANADIYSLRKMFGSEPPRIYIEGIQAMGMAVGAEVFKTAYQIGRIQKTLEINGFRYTMIKRTEVKIHHCNSVRAKDTNIRQALIDRFGAPGTKKAPGATYGIKADIWSAAAIAVMAYDHLTKPEL